MFLFEERPSNPEFPMIYMALGFILTGFGIGLVLLYFFSKKVTKEENEKRLIHMTTKNGNIHSSVVSK